MLTSNIPFSEVPNNGINNNNDPFPSLFLEYSQYNIMSFDQGFIIDQINQEEYIIFQS